MQAEFLIRVLAEDRPDDLIEAYHMALDFGPKWLAEDRGQHQACASHCGYIETPLVMRGIGGVTTETLPSLRSRSGRSGARFLMF